jgi:porin
VTGRTGERLYLACILVAVGLGSISLKAEERPKSILAVTDAPQPSASALPAAAAADPAAVESTASGISGNLAGVNVTPGTGQLGQALGFGPDSGVRIGGVWVGNANFLPAGGEKPWQSSFNSLLVTGLNLDFGRLANLPGGQFGAQFLQFNGQPTNREAGVVTGYNGLPGPPPLVRSELYQLWWRQSLFDEKLVVRIGKSVPTYDFNNVTRPVQTRDESLMIPSVTGLI